MPRQQPGHCSVWLTQPRRVHCCAVPRRLLLSARRREKAWIKAGRVDDKMATQNEPFYLRY